jgi:hypothetical protein
MGPGEKVSCGAWAELRTCAINHPQSQVLSLNERITINTVSGLSGIVVCSTSINHQGAVRAER